MYQNISVHFAQARHSDMVAAAARERSARGARPPAHAQLPRVSRRGGTWQLVWHLRPQTQA